MYYLYRVVLFSIILSCLYHLRPPSRGTTGEIICSASSFVLYWSDLQNSDDKVALEVGAETLIHALLFRPQETPTNDAGLILLQ